MEKFTWRLFLQEVELRFPDINHQTGQMDDIEKVILNNQKLPSHITGEEGMIDMKVDEAIY